MKPHPKGFHHSDQAREACWACSHPEMLSPSTEDEDYARKLIKEGWLSVSNKYRTLGWHRKYTTKELLQPQHHGTFVEKELQDWLSRMHSMWVRCDGKKLELTPQQYYAFKKAGGQSA